MRISARGITRRFAAVTALADVSFDLPAGHGLGVTGAAGSGRTTLLRILATLIAPSSGTLVVGGMDASRQLSAVRTHVAYAGTRPVEAAGLRVAEYLRFILHMRGARAGIDHTRRVREALREANVGSTEMVDALDSRGRGAVALAAALVVRPDVLVVDDVLDEMPRGAREHFLECLAGARSHGSTIVLATNHGETLTAACDRVLRLERGRVVDDLTASASAFAVAAATASGQM